MRIGQAQMAVQQTCGQKPGLTFIRKTEDFTINEEHWVDRAILISVLREEYFDFLFTIIFQHVHEITTCLTTIGKVTNKVTHEVELDALGYKGCAISISQFLYTSDQFQCHIKT